METLQKELERAEEERRQAFEDKREYDWKFWQGYVNALKFAIGVRIEQTKKEEQSNDKTI